MRMTTHRCDTKKKVNKSVSNNFNPDSHNIPDISVIVLDHAPSKLMSQMTREPAWIQTLRTLEPHGLDVKDS